MKREEIVELFNDCLDHISEYDDLRNVPLRSRLGLAIAALSEPQPACQHRELLREVTHRLDCDGEPIADETCACLAHRIDRAQHDACAPAGQQKHTDDHVCPHGFTLGCVACCRDCAPADPGEDLDLIQEGVIGSNHVLEPFGSWAIPQPGDVCRVYRRRKRGAGGEG